MIHLKDYIDMNWSMIITYTISDDSVREDFVNWLEDEGFESQPDQSVTALSFSKRNKVTEICNEIGHIWRENPDLFESGDSIVAYKAAAIKDGDKYVAGIQSLTWQK